MASETGQPRTEVGPGAAPDGGFPDLAAALLSGGATDPLQTVIDLAVATVEGCDFAGIFTLENGAILTAAQTAPIVAEIDGLQHQTGEGPCLDAVAQGAVVYAADLLEEDRWPSFAPAAMGAGMRSVLALPVFEEGTVGALNLYSTYPMAFGVADRARGLLMAGLVGVALTAVRMRELEERQAENLRAALVTREIIGQAQGILMERERIAADQAFDILRRASQHLNLKLHEVARTLVETGESPPTASPPPAS